MTTWMILMILDRVLGATCPFTSPIGAIVGIIDAIAVPVFIVLTFIFSPAWWYGLIAMSIYLGILFLFPKVDPDKYGIVLKIYSNIGSHISPLLVVWMYIDLLMK